MKQKRQNKDKEIITITPKQWERILEKDLREVLLDTVERYPDAKHITKWMKENGIIIDGEDTQTKG